MDNGYKIETNHSDELIFQDTLRVIDSQVEVLSRKMINVSEAHIRKALIEMGWTPPREDGDIKEPLDVWVEGSCPELPNDIRNHFEECISEDKNAEIFIRCVMTSIRQEFDK